MWKLLESEDYQRRVRLYEKRFDRELLAVLDNLDTYIVALNAGAKPLQVKFGFLHMETMGVVAIDQKGGGKSLKETRLYVYPEIETHIVHVITIGDKTIHGQRADINKCRDFVALRRGIVANEQEGS